jgi:choline-phosphate cytidylyltransferase
MLLLVKSGIIGEVKSVDSICTSLSDLERRSGKPTPHTWNSICAWGPTALLPIFQLLGINYKRADIISKRIDRQSQFDGFSKISFLFDHAVASAKVAKSAKSEGELVISGTKGYIYVPSPWWKTDYFELRFENPADNKRYFYQVDGEGIRYELVQLVSAIHNSRDDFFISRPVTEAICGMIEHTR